MPRISIRSLSATCGLILLAAGAARAQSATTLDQVSIEDLLNIEVTSASKKEQTLFRTAAAVYVLTNEDLRRSGVTTIPDALRLVPGLQVASIDANKWAVSARGSNGMWANKLLVLMDGRVIYTPVTSGVYWDLQDVLLEDVDRIEVVRGPGASVWGVNAVNGVINIISKPAESTQGGLVSVASGSVTPGIAAFRFGGHAGDRGFYRVFGKHASRGPFVDGTGADASDTSRMSQVGFRVDFAQNDTDSWSAQGSAQAGESGQRINQHLSSYVPAPRVILSNMSPAHTGNVLARWTRTRSRDSGMSLQAFWDRSYRFVVGKGETTQTFDVEFQHRFRPRRNHDVVWGAGQRFWSDREEVVFGEFFDPTSSRIRLFNAFLQNEIAIVADRLYLTAGVKFEHNSVAGVELQPTVRLAWLPTSRQTVWAALSRGARTPARLERALHVDVAAFRGAGGQLMVVGIRGNPDLRTEHTTASEIGYRIEPGTHLSFEVAAFYNVSRDLKTENAATAFETTPGPPHVLLLRQFASGMGSESAGAELLVRWRPAPIWTIEGGYDWLQTHLRDIGTTPEALIVSDRNPTHQARVRSQVNLHRSWQLDTTWMYVGALTSVDVPGYVRADVRIGGSIGPGLSLTLVGQNLLTPRHQEFAGFEGVYNSEVPRSWQAKLAWAF